ncbi:MAG: hypothetical protein R3A52_12865 [Polyangiales bacterium]
MIAAIWRDGPRAVLASLLATAALVVLSFRAARAAGSPSRRSSWAWRGWWACSRRCVCD